MRTNIFSTYMSSHDHNTLLSLGLTHKITPFRFSAHECIFKDGTLLILCWANPVSFGCESCPLHKANWKNEFFILLDITMPRLSDNERHRALGLLEGGMSIRQVARRMGCSPPTIMNLRRRYQETQSVNDRQRPGRERVTTPAVDRHIVLQHLRDRCRTATQTAAETPGRRQPRISRSTVQRRLHAANLSARKPKIGVLLNPVRRRNRLQWAQRHLPWTQGQWRSVLFTDESRFCQYQNDGRRLVWRRPGERYAECCVRQSDRWGGCGVMVWAGVSSNFRTPLVVINGNLTARRYIDEVLETTFRPFQNAHPEIQVLQQDNARPHTARITMAYLHQHDIDVLPWPPYSPDLSPIENLWDQLGRRVSRRTPPPRNRQELVAALHQEWQNIPQDNIRRLIRSMRRRCVACIDSNGGHTKY